MRGGGYNESLSILPAWRVPACVASACPHMHPRPPPVPPPPLPVSALGQRDVGSLDDAQELLLRARTLVPSSTIPAPAAHASGPLRGSPVAPTVAKAVPAPAPAPAPAVVAPVSAGAASKGPIPAPAPAPAPADTGAPAPVPTAVGVPGGKVAVTGKAAIRASASVGKPTVSGATATASSGPNKPAPATSSAGAGKAGGPGGRWASVVRGTPASTPPAVVTTEPSAFPALGAGSGVPHAVPQAPAPVASAAKSVSSAAAPAPAHAPAPTPAPAPVSAATAPSSLLPAPSSTAVAEASTPSPLLLPPALPAPALTPDMRVVVDSELEAVMSDPSDATLALILNRCMFGDAKALASVRHVHSTLGFTLLIAAARLGR